jgi:hypothetical protein
VGRSRQKVAIAIFSVVVLAGVVVFVATRSNPTPAPTVPAPICDGPHAISSKAHEYDGDTVFTATFKRGTTSSEVDAFSTTVADNCLAGTETYANAKGLRILQVLGTSSEPKHDPNLVFAYLKRSGLFTSIVAGS